MRLKFIIALLLVGGALSAQVRPWKKQTIPVSTPWFEDISPENVWPEYPRPQLERTEWMNLNGIWKLKQDTKGNLQCRWIFHLIGRYWCPFP